MTIKDIKQEARKKLALNMHQAIVIYTVEFTVFITLIALVVMSCVSLGVNTPAAIVMICYGIVLGIFAIVASGMVNFALADYYLATYRCKPYNIRRLGDTLARSNITKVLLLSLKRTVFAILLLLCLIVPGVIYLIRTSMANYLLIANPKMKASTALSASNKVMSGKTGAYFSLCVSLIGWYILGVLTLGLGFIFILPYINLIKAVYYKRNLQGDKTVYNTVVQPVVAYPQPDVLPNPQQMQAQPASAVGAVQPPQDVQNVDPSGPAPIDAFADEDLQDMQDAMRSFSAPNRSSVDIPEVPISPVTVTTSSNASESIVQPDVPMQDDFGDVSDSARKLEGTDLVETERILTTQEIDMSEAARQDAFARIDRNYVSNRPVIDYISAQSNQSDDDFMTNGTDDFGMSGEEQTPIDAPDENTAADVDDPVMSDNEFAEFLRNFDGVPEPEKEFTPLKRSEKADTKNQDEVTDTAPPQVRPVPDRAAQRAAVRDERRTAGRASSPDLADRLARIKKEREERLNKLKNK